MAFVLIRLIRGKNLFGETLTSDGCLRGRE
jgi:hypothetical protein